MFVRAIWIWYGSNGGVLELVYVIIYLCVIHRVKMMTRKKSGKQAGAVVAQKRTRNENTGKRGALPTRPGPSPTLIPTRRCLSYNPSRSQTVSNFFITHAQNVGLSQLENWVEM